MGKLFLTILLTLLLFCFFTVKASAHCEIPCGIYDDELRISMLNEHITTIEKSMNQIMKIGVVFPQLEIGTDPVIIRDYAQTIEGLGYDFLLAYEHTLGADPDAYQSQGFVYTYNDMFHEPFVLFAHLAAVAKKQFCRES